MRACLKRQTHVVLFKTGHIHTHTEACILTFLNF